MVRAKKRCAGDERRCKRVQASRASKTRTKQGGAECCAGRGACGCCARAWGRTCVVLRRRRTVSPAAHRAGRVVDPGRRGASSRRASQSPRSQTGPEWILIHGGRLVSVRGQAAAANRRGGGTRGAGAALVGESGVVRAARCTRRTFRGTRRRVERRAGGLNRPIVRGYQSVVASPWRARWHPSTVAASSEGRAADRR